MFKFLVACCTYDVIAFRFEMLKSEADRVIYDNGSFFSSPHGYLEHKKLMYLHEFGGLCTEYG